MTERYIAAIGGSAGILEPLKEFFDHTPNDNVSYVILRHLSRNHQSMLKHILSKHAILDIIEVDSEMLIQKNKIYLLPAGKYMVIENDTFHLVERDESGPNRAVDVFLQSMAWDKGSKGIAVILSGAGWDGTKGSQHIKEAGGLVIVQDPDSCEHSSMPEHVLKSGSADYTLLPREMPDMILRHIQSNQEV